MKKHFIFFSVTVFSILSSYAMDNGKKIIVVFPSDTTTVVDFQIDEFGEIVQVWSEQKNTPEAQDSSITLVTIKETREILNILEKKPSLLEQPESDIGACASVLLASKLGTNENDIVQNWNP
jgi:hypothetical protein